MQRRSFMLQAAVLAGSASFAPVARAATAFDGLAGDYEYHFSYEVVRAWNRALLATIAATRTQATIAARAISMLNEALYNAWAAYDSKAAFTLSGLSKRGDRSSYRLKVALGNAADVVLSNLFPTQRALWVDLMDGIDDNYTSGNVAAQQAGSAAANALLAMRRSDGSNQANGYADTTGYAAVNTPDAIVDPSRWQPLRLVDAAGATVVQRYLTPHWGLVTPFALASGSIYRPAMAVRTPALAHMQQLIDFSAGLNDPRKAQVDLWAANPGSVSPPGQWIEICEQVAETDDHDLDRDVKLYFAVAQALLDASIAAWDCKRAYDSIRPLSAIRYFYAGQTITAWGGPNQGARSILGQAWHPFQRTTSPTPPFPEYVSGHSTFSAAASTVIAGLRSGGDSITITGVMARGSVGFETNVPSASQTFRFPTLSAAAAHAGESRRWGGIHFEPGDLEGRALGRKVGGAVLDRCRRLYAGISG